jgi:hypothetical protein
MYQKVFFLYHLYERQVERKVLHYLVLNMVSPVENHFLEFLFSAFLNSDGVKYIFGEKR